MLVVVFFGFLIALLEGVPTPQQCSRDSVDFWGADIGFNTAGSLEKCEEICREMDTCASLSFRASSDSCWLKNKRGGLKGPYVKIGLVSMNMDCGDKKFDQTCIEKNTDYWGADIGGRRALNFDQCETFCRDAEECVSITYRAADSQCWLKYNRFGAYGPSPGDGLTSLNMNCTSPAKSDVGCKRIDVDFWGTDIRYKKTDNLEECEKLCKDTDECVSLTYRSSNRFCWLKNKRGGLRGPYVKGGLVSLNMDFGDTKSDQSCIEENTDYWGADIGGRRALNFDQCETFCRDAEECVSITYRAADSQCWLKYNRFGAYGPVQNDGLASLNMDCAAQLSFEKGCERLDVDFWGADIGFQTTESVESCEEWCKKTEGCASLTYRESDFSCWLKNKRGGIRGPYVKGGLVSLNMDCGDKTFDQTCIEENTDYWGADIGGRRALNFDQCETFCRDAEECVSITYRAADSQCWLKNNSFGENGPSPGNGLTSLNMDCPTEA